MTVDLERAKAGDERAFASLVEPFRRELQLHCYRLLGSVQDAEDLVQETLLAAWRGLDGFEERASLRPAATQPALARRLHSPKLLLTRRGRRVTECLVETTVRPLDHREIRRASCLLAAAFADDPFIGHFLRARRRRNLVLPRFFRAVLHELSVGGATYALDAEGILAGVAAWSPPETTRSDRASRLLARVAQLEFRALFPRASSEMLGGFEELGRRHPAFPHWYLAFIGIDPRWQRHGFGRALLEPVLARADAAGVACYLETPFPDTRPFYERFGFHESDQLRPVDGAPPIWTMTRRPNS